MRIDGTMVSSSVPALSAVVLRADRKVADAGAEQSISLTPVAGAELAGMVPVTADIADDRWAETSFSFRIVGETAYHPLGTAEDDTPRVFHDVSALPAGTLVEYRAVTVDADGTPTAASTFGVVGADLSGVVPEPEPEPEPQPEPQPQRPVQPYMQILRPEGTNADGPYTRK